MQVELLSTSVDKATSAFSSRDWNSLFDAVSLPCIVSLHALMWFWSLGVFPFPVGVIVLLISLYFFIKFTRPSSNYQIINDKEQLDIGVRNLSNDYTKALERRTSTKIRSFFSFASRIKMRKISKIENKLLKNCTEKRPLYRPSIGLRLWGVFFNPLSIISWIMTRISLIDRKTAIIVIGAETLMVYWLYCYFAKVVNSEKQQLIHALSITQEVAINNPVNVSNVAYVNTRAFIEEQRSQGMTPFTPKWLNK